MYILFEEHQYESHLVEEVLKDIYVLQDVDKKVCVQYVGYFYNPHLRDCVFILPKVLLTEQETLVGVRLPSGESVPPEQILTPKAQESLSQEYRKFIYEFSVWIYRALSVFHKANPNTKAILHRHLPQAGQGARHRANTYLDIVLSLIAFNKENRDFVLFTIKNLHRGNNKINWTRTISRTQAFVQNTEVVYPAPINKKRVVNYEEELFVIFYSILNYLNEEYGFRTPIDFQYDLIQGKRFKQYINGLGKTRLMQIKYKYFADKELQLWDMCFAFFECTHRIAIHTHAQEYLLTNNFNVVFEAMIDELIGDRDIPNGLKGQLDGKRVDHLYTYDGLTISNDQDDQIYYIGDSKYYKAGNKLGSESVYKQFTYARNVIQWNIDLFANGSSTNWRNEKFDEDKEKYGRIRLRDDEADPLTEGYNVIPNFFISAFVDEEKRYNNGENIKVVTETVDGKKAHKTYVSIQFPNRLFDRDTLILSHYNVNFLYVIYLYARNKQNEKAAWRQEVRKIFRREIRQVLSDRYDFYAMKCKGDPLAGEEFIKEHFKELHGKLYRPYGDKNLYSLALEKHKNEDSQKSEVYYLLEEIFEIEKVDLTSGENPKQKLEENVQAYQANHPYTPTPEAWLPTYHLERYLDNRLVIGMYHDQAHWDWITGKNDKGTLIYNVRLAPDRPGSMTQSSIKRIRPKFAILYEEGHENDNKYHVFHIHDTAKIPEERMRKALYPRDPQGDYFIFRFDEEVSIGRLDIARYLSEQSQDPGFVYGMPLYPTAKELLSYRL